MSHLCQSKMSHIEDCEDVYVGPVCWQKPTGVEGRTDARMGVLVATVNFPFMAIENCTH